MTSRILSTIGLLLLLPEMVCVRADETSPNQAPNVVVILVDDMGYGDPQCFNPESKIATPNIDALARDGLKFTDAHAPGPLCHMSRYGLMTGRYPFRTDVSKWPTQPLIEKDRMTIASLLKSHGYQTAMVGNGISGLPRMATINRFRVGRSMSVSSPILAFELQRIFRLISISATTVPSRRRRIGSKRTRRRVGHPSRESSGAPGESRRDWN